MARLNGWQRLGVIASALWIVIASAIVTGEWATFRGDQGTFVYHDLTLRQAIEPELSRKSDAAPQLPHASGIFDDLIPRKKHLRVGNIAAFLLLPVIAAWLLVYLTRWSITWVRAGFKKEA
jgi:hypothetical protein